jgi:hypothetical protein
MDTSSLIGDGTIREKARGFELRFWYIDPTTGVKKRRSITGPTLEAIEARRTAFLAAIDPTASVVGQLAVLSHDQAQAVVTVLRAVANAFAGLHGLA